MMLKNHLKVALRYLKNHKGYTFTNIFGLTFGFLCFLILNAYVSSEKSFDTIYPDTYRLTLKEEDSEGNLVEIAALGPQIGYASAGQFAEIEAVTEIIELMRVTVGNDPADRNYELVTIIDSSFFEVFGFQLLEGSVADAFSQKNAIILPHRLKEKYFGDQPAQGKTLKLNDQDMMVAAVMEDFPFNTHLEADVLLPASTASAMFDWWDKFVTTNWHRNSFVTYLQINPNADIKTLEGKITQLAKENWPEDEQFGSQALLTPLQDIHLLGHEVQGAINKAKGNPLHVRIFFWIALTVLLVACFNYTGLLNVAFMGRSKEIGVRKVMGAGRRQLMSQFMAESLLLSCTSMLLALGLLQVSEPLLPQFFGPAFNLSALPLTNIMLIAALGLAISLLSIGYPSYLISRQAVVKALKEEHKGRQKLPFQKAITIFQFVAAIGLIACTSILYRQVSYMENKKLGFELDNMVVMDINSYQLRNQFESIKQAFSKLPEVQSVSVSSRVPGEWKQFPLVQVHKQGAQVNEKKDMIFVCGDADFLETYEISLLDGQNFRGLPSDSTKVLINQSAAEALGMEQPLGQPIVIPQVNWAGDANPLETPFLAQIEGVVSDFHFENFGEPIKPMIIAYWNNPIHSIDYYSLRVNTEDWSQTLSSLQAINNEFDPENPIEYHMLNEQFERFYREDLQRSHLLLFFAGVVIFIASLGLLAMTAFVLKKRTKEIGVRKVLGASARQIVQLVASDFMKLVLYAALIAIPISWLLMNRWLEEFAYRIDLRWWLFAAAGIITVLLALLVVSIQSARTALSNPVDALRSE